MSQPFFEPFAEGDLVRALELIEDDQKQGCTTDNTFMAVIIKTILEDFQGALQAVELLTNTGARGGRLGPEMEHCVRAEMHLAKARHDPTVAGRRVTLGLPPVHAPLYAQAAAQHVSGQYEQAKQTLDEAEQKTPPTKGTITTKDGKNESFSNLMDSDVLTGPHLVAIVPNSVLHLPFSSLSQVDFIPPGLLNDHYWLPCRICCKDGNETLARVPMLYSGSGLREDRFVRVGRETLWDYDKGYAIGLGQRDFWLDGPRTRVMGILDVQMIELE